MRRLLFAVLFTVVCTAGVVTQPKPLEGFDDYVARAARDWRAPGLAVVVIKNDEVVFERGYGVRELGKSGTVDEHTLFAIGSTTKAMTAALAAMLVDEKKLEWDAPVTRYLPWFQMKDPAVSHEVSVRDLLTHRAGLGNADYLWYGQHGSTEEILRRVRLIDPVYPVRSGFIYQNIMYAAAGAVVEAASGTSWPNLIRTRIFEPLGMKDSQATAARLSSLPNVASPHAIVDGRVRVIENASVDPVAAAGAVWSSVDDMSKWMKFMLDGGRIGGRSGTRLLSEESFRELFTPQTIAPYEMYPTTRITRPHWMTYGLGWFQQDYRGQALDFHTGSIDGMVAIHGLVRDEGLGVYVLGNLDHAELRHALMYTVIDRYAGRRDRDWSAEFLKLYDDLKNEGDRDRAKRNAARITGTSPSLSLAKYAGTYSEPLHGDVKVTQDGAGLRLQYGSAFVGPLEHWHYNTFRAQWDAVWREPDLVTFVIDADGKASAIEMIGTRFVRAAETKESLR
jgi:CubicO group peptidase (beta-lactamase class C family)